MCETSTYTTTRMVPETVRKQVPYTVIREVREECVKQVPYTVTKMVPLHGQEVRAGDDLHDGRRALPQEGAAMRDPHAAVHCLQEGAVHGLQADAVHGLQEGALHRHRDVPDDRLQEGPGHDRGNRVRQEVAHGAVCAEGLPDGLPERLLREQGLHHRLLHQWLHQRLLLPGNLLRA